MYSQNDPGGLTTQPHLTICSSFRTVNHPCAVQCLFHHFLRLGRISSFLHVQTFTDSSDTKSDALILSEFHCQFYVHLSTMQSSSRAIDFVDHDFHYFLNSHMLHPKWGGEGSNLRPNDDRIQFNQLLYQLSYLPVFPIMRLLMSGHIGFLFLKNLLGFPVKNIQVTGRLYYLSLFP